MKRLLIMLLIGILSIGISACGASETSQEETTQDTEATTEVQSVDRTIDAVADALGLMNKSDVYYTVIGAQDGAEYNDGAVELYLYDPEDQTYLDIVSGNGVIDAVAVNNGFVFVVPDGNETDTEIVAKFKDINIK